MTEDEKEARNWAADWAWDGTMYWCLRNEEELLGMQFAIRAFLAGVEHGRNNPVCYDATHETKEGWASWVAKDEAEHLERIRREVEK